jgi:hypothetical protein
MSDFSTAGVNTRNKRFGLRDKAYLVQCHQQRGRRENRPELLVPFVPTRLCSMHRLTRLTSRLPEMLVELSQTSVICSQRGIKCQAIMIARLGLPVNGGLTWVALSCAGP